MMERVIGLRRLNNMKMRFLVGDKYRIILINDIARKENYSFIFKPLLLLTLSVDMN